MILVVSSWYNEPDISFKISYMVNNYLRERIKEFIMQPLGLLEIDTNIYLSINVTTNIDQNELEVRFGRFSKRSEFYRVGFWFPYNKITNAESPIKAYLENYILATKIMFAKWNVTDEQINQLSADVFNEILNNREYDYLEEEF